MNQEEKKRFSLKYWQLMTVFLASYDLLAIHAAYFLALWLRFDFVFSRIPPEHYGRYTHFITLYAFGSILIFGFFRMYRGMWTLAGINEMLHIFEASLLTSAAHIILITLILGDILYPRSTEPE